MRHLQRIAVFIAALTPMLLPAQEHTLEPFNPDSVFTLDEQAVELRLEQEVLEANRAIAGAWQIDKPAVRAQGTSLVGKLGKPIAQSKIKKKLDKAYKKLKVKQRWTLLELDETGRWAMVVVGKRITGQYTYDLSRGALTLRWHGLPMTAQVRREGKRLHLLFDSDRLLTLMRLVSGLSHSDTLRALAFLSENYQDVMVGFSMKPAH